MAGNPLKRRTLSSPPSSAFSPCYSNVKQVFLSDWWLIKPDGDDCRGLRIGGINSDRRLGIRVFRSAEIQKRHDSVTLETADGITVYIRGDINRSRTFENGFSQQVCDHFGFGFPYDWDEFVDGSFPEDRADYKFTESIGNLPRCLIHDFSPSIELSTSMFEDILQKFGNKAKEGASQSSQTNETQNSTDKDAPTKKKTAAQLDPETRREKLPKTVVDERIRSDCDVMRKGPLTRSMAHMAQSEKKKKTNETDMAQSEKKKNEIDMAQSEKKKKKKKKKKKNETDMTESKKTKMNEIDMAQLEKKKNETDMAQSEKKKMNETVLENPPCSVRAPKAGVSKIAGNITASSTSAAPEIRRLNLRSRNPEIRWQRILYTLV